MNKLNYVLKKGIQRNNDVIKYFSKNFRFHNFYSIKSFTSNQVSSNLNSYLHPREFPLYMEEKIKKSEEIFQTISKKYEQIFEITKISNLASHLTKKSKIDYRENSILYRLEELYTDFSQKSHNKTILTELNNESNFPKLKELRENLLKSTKSSDLKEIINSFYKSIQDNLTTSDNKLSLIEDSLKFTNCVANYINNNNSISPNGFNKSLIKECTIGHLSLLNSVDSLSLSIEIFKQNENFLFNIIENYLKIQDLSEVESRLTQAISTNLLKCLERFGDVITKYSGNNSQEMFNLYFTLAYYHLNKHNSDDSKAEDYINKAAAIIKLNEDVNNPHKDIRNIQVNYILAEIQLNHRKNLKEGYVQLEEAMKLLNDQSNFTQSTVNDEVFVIIKTKIAQEYSRLLLIAKEKFDKVVEISDNLKDYQIQTVDILKKYPNTFESYLSHLNSLSTFLQIEGFKRKSYDYLKHIYNLKREINTERDTEIDSLGFLFEDSSDYYFTSGNLSKLFNKNELSLDALKSFTFYLSNIFQDSLNTSIDNFSDRILFANKLKSIIDNIQKFKNVNGIKFENEEKFVLNHLLSTIRLNSLSAEFERAEENLNKAIELLNKTENSQKSEALINLNLNLYFTLRLLDKKENRTINTLLDLKKILKNYFESSKNLEAVVLLIETNFDLYELYFEVDKVNDGINCLIEASELNKQFEKVDYSSFKFYSNKLKKIRDNIQSLKEKVEKEANNVNQQTQMTPEKEESDQNKVKKNLYGIFSKK